MPAYSMLIAAVTLVFAELVGLSALLVADAMPAWTIGLTMVAIALGVIAVAISPVVRRFAQALREANPDKILPKRQRLLDRETGLDAAANRHVREAPPTNDARMRILGFAVSPAYRAPRTVARVSAAPTWSEVDGSW